MISLYQGEREYLSITYMVFFPSCISGAFDWLDIWCNSSSLQFELDKNFARPCPLISLVVFICR
jgi:hypothetical protein